MLNLIFGSAVSVEGNYLKTDKTENMKIIDVKVDKNLIGRVAASMTKKTVICVLVIS